jgi:hypothetical protein
MLEAVPADERGQLLKIKNFTTPDPPKVSGGRSSSPPIQNPLASA